MNTNIEEELKTEFIKKGKSPLVASRLAQRKIAEIEREQRRQRRVAFVSHLVSHGYTESQAECAYCAGPGCQSIDWVGLKHKVEREVSYAQEYLTLAIEARNHQDTARYSNMFFPESNKHTMQSYCSYALEVFFGGRKQYFPRGRDYPVVGKGWQLVNP